MKLRLSWFEIGTIFIALLSRLLFSFAILVGIPTLVVLGIIKLW